MMPDQSDQLPDELRAALPRRLRDFLRDDASGLYQKFWESTLAQWAAGPIDDASRNDRAITATLLAEMIQQGAPSSPRPRAVSAGSRIAVRATSPPPARQTPADHADVADESTDSGAVEQDRADLRRRDGDSRPAATAPRRIISSGMPGVPAVASPFAPGETAAGGVFGALEGDIAAVLAPSGGIFSPPAPRNGNAAEIGHATIDAEALAPPQTDEQRAMTAASRKMLATLARWLGEATAASTPSAIGGDATLRRFAADVLRICELLDSLRKSAGPSATSARQRIESARQISKLFYEGVYDRWRGAATTGRFRLGDIGRAADELKQSLAADPGLAARVFIEHGAPTYDSYRHELSPGTARPPERVLPMSFGVSAAPPDEQAWRVMVRPFDPTLVQLEAAG